MTAMKKNTRNYLLLASLLLALLSGFQLFRLWQAEQLWGHWPLLFFASCWLSTVLALWRRYAQEAQGLRWTLLSSLSGVLLGISFPPSPLTPVLFIAWVPLLMTIHEIDSSGGNRRQVLRYSYHAFVLWNIIATWWVGNTALVAGMVAIWLNSFFMAIPMLLYFQTKRVIPGLSWLAFAAYWISFEWLHLHWEISWAWLNLGNAFAQLPSWVQWYEYTGTFGGTLWVIATNVLVFQLLKNNDFKPSLQAIAKNQLPRLAALVALISLPILASLVMYSNYVEKGREVRVAVVQPNLEPHYQKFQLPVSDQLRRFLRLSEKIVNDSTEYLLWPETSFTLGELGEMNSHAVVRQARNLMRPYPDLKLVTGVTAYKIFGEGEAHTSNTRTEIQGSDTLYWEVYNAAVQVSNQVDSLPFYAKSKLVPGPEILPYRWFFFFLKPLVDKLDGTVEGLGTQSYRESFGGGTGRIAPVICYESIYGEYHAEYVKAGAQATFIMTNDGWWDRSAGHKQHLKYARLRAIETRRSIARSANTGISCFINQRGEILQPTDYGEETAISGTIRFNDQITFYVKWGDLIARLGLGTALLLALNTFVRSFVVKPRSL
jgi:apolipoprotein N-acyltransferase